MCSLDKGNDGNAKLFGFLEDVGMTSRKFNLALMYLSFTYGLAEPVSNVALRGFGVHFESLVWIWEDASAPARAYGREQREGNLGE